MRDKNTQDNSVEDSTMSLGDHLEELRARLIMALLGLSVALIVCLFFGKPLIKLLEWPYAKAMRQSERTVEIPIPKDANSPSAFVYGKHMIVVLEISDPELNKATAVTLRMSPPADANSGAARSTARDLIVAEIDGSKDVPILQTLGPAEGFLTYMKIALIAAIVIASPWVFHHIWMFVAAGLYPHEKRYVRTAVPFCAGLFIAGAMFCLFVVARLSMKFLVIFNQSFLGVQSNFTFDKYISFITLLMLVFGIAFQTPIAIYLLSRTGLVSTEALRRSRRYVILATVIIAAIATPGPDPFSQMTLAIPLYLLFELGILLADRAQRRRKAEAT